MPVPFGISIGRLSDSVDTSCSYTKLRIGDFIATIKAFSDVVQALKDSGGASAEYEQVKSQLQTALAILQQAERIQLPAIAAEERVASYVRAIYGQAQACQDIVSSFNQKVQKYDPALSTKAPKGFYRATWTKIKWAIHFSDKVAAMQATVAGHLDLMGL